MDFSMYYFLYLIFLIKKFGRQRRRFFIGTYFCTKNLGIWKFLGQETYIHFVAQETRII